MNLEKYIRKEILYSQIFILIGITAGVTGFIFGYQKDLMFGMTIGFLPTGIGTLLIYKYAKRRPDLKKNLVLQNEERNIFIKTKSGYTAFWVSYWYILVTLILSHVIRIPLQQFLIVTLFFMPLMYFLIVFIFHKKY